MRPLSGAARATLPRSNYWRGATSAIMCAQSAEGTLSAAADLA